jgi:hypothetical protein
LQGRLADSLEAVALSALWYGACVAVLAKLRAPHNRVLAATLLVVATGAQLIWRNATSSLNAEPLEHYSVLQAPSSSEQAGLDFLTREIAARRAAGGRPRVEILGLDGPWQNASMVYGFENSLGYNPLRIADYERLVGPGDNAGDINLRHFPGTFRSYGGKLANLLGLEYLVLDEPMARTPRRFPRPSATQVFAGDKIFIYRLGRAAPRAYIANAIMPADTNAVLNAGALPDFDMARQALVDPADIGEVSAAVSRIHKPSPGEAGAGRVGDPQIGATPEKVSILSYHDNDVTLEVTADRTAVVVLHDLFYPGWQVFVDGERKPLLRANLLFRGVETPPGNHVVKFIYRPFSLENLLAALRGVNDRAN